MLRMRLVYTKTKEASYILPSDMVYVLDKALTRTGATVIYGKDQTPSVIIAEPLPQGIESVEEICDVDIKEYIDITYLIKGINKFLPKGIVLLSAEYIDKDVPGISDSCYASEFEIIPEYEDIEKMNRREISDLRAWFRENLTEYLEEESILVLVKSSTRNERINIKPIILEYSVNINDGLRITISNDTSYIFNPSYIMDGFIEYVDRQIKYSIRRTKILYKWYIRRKYVKPTSKRNDKVYQV